MKQFILYLENVRRLFFLVLLFSISGKGLAQTYHPLGGYIYIEKLGKGYLDQRYTITANILFNQTDKIPQFVTFNILMYKEGVFKIERDSVTQNLDSTITVSYPMYCNFLDNYEMPYPITVTIDSSYVYEGQNMVGTKPIFYLKVNHQTRLCTFSPAFNLDVIHVKPDEDFRGNLYRYNLNTDDIVRFDEIAYLYYEDFRADTNIFIQYKSGDMFWPAPHKLGTYKNALENKYNRMMVGNFPIFTFAVDSSIKSIFVFNKNDLDSNGLIGIRPQANDTAYYHFAFVDHDADSIVPEWHTTFDQFDTVKPIITYTKSGDSLLVDFKVYVSPIMKYYSPGSFSFVFKSLKSTRKCFNRYFSFYVNDSNTTNTGLEKIAYLNELTVYPNPANNQLYINSNIKSINSKLYNTLGELIITSGATIIDTKDLATGLYYLTIYNSNSEIIGNRRVVIEH